MTIEQTVLIVSLLLPIVSLLLSVVSIVIAVISLRRTSVYKKFDYAARIDIVDELIQFGRPAGNQTHIASIGSGAGKGDMPTLIKGGQGFGYRASLQNKGEKSIPIYGVHLDYGAKHDTGKRMKHTLEGRFHLAPGEAHQVEFSLPLSKIEKTMREFGVQQCLFWLRVTYESPNGKKSKFIRPLGGFEGGQVMFVANAGVTLS